MEAANPITQILEFEDSIPFATYSEHIHNNADATVLIHLFSQDGASIIRQGSGIIVHPNYLLTCHHVLRTEEEARRAEVKFRVRRARDISQALTVRLKPDVGFYSDPELDYTLVAIEPHPRRPAAFVMPKCSAPRSLNEAGRSIYSLSHPRGQPLRLSPSGRRITIPKGLLPLSHVTFTSEVHGGSSGGGVYDSHTGDLIALVTHESAAYNRGTNIKAIWKHLQGRSNLADKDHALYTLLQQVFRAIHTQYDTHYLPHTRKHAEKTANLALTPDIVATGLALTLIPGFWFFFDAHDWLSYQRQGQILSLIY